MVRECVNAAKAYSGVSENWQLTPRLRRSSSDVAVIEEAAQRCVGLLADSEDA